MAVEINLTAKQSKTWELLFDDHTTQILYGGSAGSGKSWLGCLWIATLCLKYKGIRCLIGRTVLAQLKTTTLNTLFETLKNMGLKPDEHYKYNGHSNIIVFKNGSEIILKDLQLQPSDAQFDSIAGLELTACFVDECSQVSQIAINVLRSRLRFKLKQYKLIGKILMTTNPAQTWLKKEFYIPFMQGTLDRTKAFIQALPTDNHHLPESYIDTLRSLPLAQRRRLLEGDWNFMEEDDQLFTYEKITDAQFKFAPNPSNRKLMSVDVARYGTDRSVVMIWVGLALIECHTYKKIDTQDLIAHIQDLMELHGIDRSSVIIDEDGIGAPIKDAIKSKGFVNNSRPLHGQNFVNLKSQSYVKLGELFKDGKISLNIIDPEMVDQLTQELLAIKLKDMDKDNKIAIQSKDEMKKLLGVSPDLADCMMFRMWFEIANKSTGKYALTFTGNNSYLA